MSRYQSRPGERYEVGWGKYDRSKERYVSRRAFDTIDEAYAFQDRLEDDGIESYVRSFDVKTNPPRYEVPTPKRALEIMKETGESSPVGMAVSHLWRITYDVLMDGIPKPTDADRQLVDNMAQQICAMAALEGLFRQRNGGAKQGARIPVSRDDLELFGAESGYYDPATGAQVTQERGPGGRLVTVRRQRR